MGTWVNMTDSKGYRPENARQRAMIAAACIVLGVVAVVLVVTGNLLWAVIPAVAGVVLAIRLQRTALNSRRYP